MLNKKILIVGAGPVGLACSVFLHHMGCTPRLIQKRTQRNIYSKALAINPRSLDLLSSVGATSQLLRAGIKLTQATLHYQGRQLFTQEFDEVELKGNEYPFLLMLPQSRTELMLKELLEKKGGKVEMGTEVEKIGFKSGRAVVKTNKDEQAYDVVFAADGAKSTIRKALNIPFEGTTLDREIYLSDYQVPTSAQQSFTANAFMTPQSITMALPITRNAIRLVSTSEAHSQLIPQTLYKLGMQHWKTSFKINHRIAKNFSIDNVYLGGDAAHVHSPLGARGMNTGFEDAFVFAELMRRGRLQDYQQIRRPAVEEMVRKIEGMMTVGLGGRGGISPMMMKLSRRLYKAQILEFMMGLDHSIGL